jgi:hypothetical protein
VQFLYSDMTHSKNFAHDGKGSAAGGAGALPEKDNADSLGRQAGVELAEGEIIATREKLVQRDEDRWELDADSAQSTM